MVNSKHRGQKTKYIVLAVLVLVTLLVGVFIFSRSSTSEYQATDNSQRQIFLEDRDDKTSRTTLYLYDPISKKKIFINNNASINEISSRYIAILREPCKTASCSKNEYTQFLDRKNNFKVIRSTDGSRNYSRDSKKYILTEISKNQNPISSEPCDLYVDVIIDDEPLGLNLKTPCSDDKHRISLSWLQDLLIARYVGTNYRVNEQGNEEYQDSIESRKVIDLSDPSTVQSQIDAMIETTTSNDVRDLDLLLEGYGIDGAKELDAFYLMDSMVIKNNLYLLLHDGNDDECDYRIQSLVINQPYSKEDIRVTRKLESSQADESGNYCGWRFGRDSDELILNGFDDDEGDSFIYSVSKNKLTPFSYSEFRVG